jgi:hypothetical protein
MNMEMKRIIALTKAMNPPLIIDNTKHLSSPKIKGK